MPLGIVDDAEYPVFRSKLDPGDVIVLYTDGVSDAIDHQGEPFGITRVVEAVKSFDASTPEEIGKSVVRQIRQHMGKENQPDDICLVSFGIPCSSAMETAH